MCLLDQDGKRIAIENPLAKDDCPDTVKTLRRWLQEGPIDNVRAVFKNLLSVLLDMRMLDLPLVYSLEPSNVIVDTKSLQVRLVLNHNMFSQTAKPRVSETDFDEFRYVSPEELLSDKGQRAVTTLMWCVGCLLYEAWHGRSPWVTKLNPLCSQLMIKKYPVVFPRSVNVKHDADFNDCVWLCLDKDPNMRLGGETFELELLSHPFFDQ